jgi:putative DNA primase/helicase
MRALNEILDKVVPKQPGLRITNVFDFVNMELPPREYILSPWLPVQGLAMIYAPRGVGKTHVALGIAHAVITQSSFLGWQAPKARNVLYLDGEMPAALMQERLLTLFGKQKQTAYANFHLLTPDLQNISMPDLATHQGQLMLEPHLKEIDLVIVDNISTLCRNSKENEADSWIPVQEWASKLRASGKSILFIHHAGKGGHQRGTSKREDILDTVIALKRPDDYSPKDGAVFQVNFEKSRCFIGEDAEAFEAQLILKENSQEWLRRPITSSSYDQVINLAKQGLKQREIADKVGINKSNVSRHLQRANQEGRLPIHN